MVYKPCYNLADLMFTHFSMRQNGGGPHKTSDIFAWNLQVHSCSKVMGFVLQCQKVVVKFNV